ncbi:MAG: hypothetical protein Kow0096_08170 [Thiohalomonadaceae bacterium]
MRWHLLAAAGFLLSASVVAAADKTAPLRGQWQCQGGEGGVLLEFQTANRLVFDGEALRYSVKGSVLLVEEEFGVVSYPYAIAGDRLTVQFPAGDVLRCTRAATRKTPATPAAGGGTAQLKGRLCNWGGSSGSTSGYYRLSAMVFDGSGGVVYSSEASFSSGAGGYYGQGGGTPGSYQVSGDTVQIRLQDGSQTTARINMRQNDGRITELMINGQLWAGALCE